MDKVTLDGKVYEKSAVVAKRYGYTADYLGQLSRAEKVEAQLVGRSWYVHAPSVEAYQAGLEEDSQEDAVEQTNSAKNNSSGDSTVQVTADNRSYPVKTHSGLDEKPFISKVSRQNVTESTKRRDTSTVNKNSSLSIDRTSTDSSRSSKSRARSRFSTTTSSERTRHWQKVAYEKDDGVLAPDIKKPRDVPPVYELGKKVRVHSSTDKFSIVASAMPEVPLRGEVSVQGVDETNDENLSLHYQEANERVRQTLSTLETESHHPESVVGYAAPVVPESVVLPTATPPKGVSSLGVRVAWTTTGILLVLAAASVLLAGETAYGEASASTFGLVFAPVDWLQFLWPF